MKLSIVYVVAIIFSFSQNVYSQEDTLVGEDKKTSSYHYPKSPQQLLSGEWTVDSVEVDFSTIKENEKKIELNTFIQSTDWIINDNKIQLFYFIEKNKELEFIYLQEEIGVVFISNRYKFTIKQISNYLLVLELIDNDTTFKMTLKKPNDD